MSGMTTTTTRSTLDTWRQDVGAFSRDLLGLTLWPHQIAVANSPKPFRVVVKARQTGGSTLLAAVAVHTAFVRSGSTSLLLSATEDASKRLAAEIRTLLQRSDLLLASVVEENKSRIELTNGSKIISLPASERQIRGYTVDGVLILDEAAFMSEALWTAARYCVAAVAAPLVYLVSTPWGGADHFFRRLFELGQDMADPDYDSFHWNYTVSPLINREFLERERERVDPLTFASEVLGEWTDAVGSYFTYDEILNAVADYPLLPPEEATGETVICGIDWGVSYDSNAIVTVAAMRDWGKNPDLRQPVFIVPWLQERKAGTTTYDGFIAEIASASAQKRAGQRAGYHFGLIVAEVNGVGQYPVEDLARRLGASVVSRVMAPSSSWEALLPWSTTARNKQDAYGRLKGLLQAGRLVLPRHPDLMRQLTHLRFTMKERTIAIEADSPAVHDDIADALALAVAGTAGYDRRRWPREQTGGGFLGPGQFYIDAVTLEAVPTRQAPQEFVSTPGGTIIPVPISTGLSNER